MERFQPDGRLYKYLSCQDLNAKVWYDFEEREWMDLLWLSFFTLDEPGLNQGYIPDGMYPCTRTLTLIPSPVLVVQPYCCTGMQVVLAKLHKARLPMSIKSKFTQPKKRSVDDLAGALPCSGPCTLIATCSS